MTTERPPTLDALAAARWSRHARAGSPWLHEEVARRMEERLQWIRKAPARWTHWEPLLGGLAVHQAIAQRYPAAPCTVVQPVPGHAAVVRRALRPAWWKPSGWRRPGLRFEPAGEGASQMVWANMALHMAAEPQALLQAWHRALAPDGFLMFSCLGPDTLRGLRESWHQAGWPPPAHEFTDMHDWGDMLVQGGFAEPVMDMERITLTFDGPRRALQELRQLGRNLHQGRFQGLRGRSWLAQMLRVLARQTAAGGQGVALEFEIIYGHAFKAPPRLPIKAETSLSLDEMRRALRQGRSSPDGPP